MKYANRGDVAADAISRWEKIMAEPFLGDGSLKLTARQRRTLKLQIRHAIGRWDAQRKEEQ